MYSNMFKDIAEGQAWYSAPRALRVEDLAQRPTFTTFGETLTHRLTAQNLKTLITELHKLKEQALTLNWQSYKNYYCFWPYKAWTNF